MFLLVVVVFNLTPDPLFRLALEGLPEGAEGEVAALKVEAKALEIQETPA